MFTARQSKLRKGDGAETFLILDTSESMQGQPFADMLQAAKALIRGNFFVNIKINQLFDVCFMK